MFRINKKKDWKIAECLELLGKLANKGVGIKEFEDVVEDVVKKCVHQ